MTASTPRIDDIENLFISGTFTGSMSGGFSANPADDTYYYIRIGNMVIINGPTTPQVGTSNATTNISITGAPAAIRPGTTTVQCTTMIRDNSVYQIGFAQINSAGTIAISKTNTSNSFTGSNSKGLGQSCSMVFYLQD